MEGRRNRKRRQRCDRDIPVVRGTQLSRPQAVGKEAKAFHAAMKSLKLPDGRGRLVRHDHDPVRTIQTGIGAVEIARVKIRDFEICKAAFEKALFVYPNEHLEMRGYFEVEVRKRKGLAECKAIALERSKLHGAQTSSLGKFPPWR
jgi:hypothetical protein